MPLILLDENLPIALKDLLGGQEVRTVRDMGWLGLSNGNLLDAAQSAGFDVMVTADKNLSYQQHLAGRRIAVIVLSTSHWQTVKPGIDAIRQALNDVTEGSYREVTVGRPKLRRRPPPLALQ